MPPLPSQVLPNPSQDIELSVPPSPHLIKTGIISDSVSNSSSKPHTSTTSSHSQHLASSDSVPRRSQRSHHPPTWLRDFHCSSAIAPSYNLTSSSKMIQQRGTRYPLSKFLSYDKFSPSYKHFVATISSLVEPTSFAQAVKDPNWHDAMVVEIIALQ